MSFPTNTTEFCITSTDGSEVFLCGKKNITGFAISLGTVIKSPEKAIVSSELMRCYVGMIVLLANVLLLLFLNSRPTLRRKYFLFTLVAIGDCFDGGYFLFPSITRMYSMTMGNYYETATLWNCILRGNMVFRIFGTELVGVSMLSLALERIIAVAFPMSYRAYFNVRKRLLMGAACVLFCLANLTVMYITSYLDHGQTTSVDYYCGISGSVTDEFALYHQNLNIVTQVSSFILCVAAYGYAIYTKKSLGLDTSKDIQAIRPVLVASGVSCVLITANNVVYILKNFTKIGVTKDTQNIVVTYTPAVFQVYKFALYLVTSKELRSSLRRLVLDDSNIRVGEAPTVVVPQNRLRKSMPATVTAVTSLSSRSSNVK